MQAFKKAGALNLQNVKAKNLGLPLKITERTII